MLVQACGFVPGSVSRFIRPPIAGRPTDFRQSESAAQKALASIRIFGKDRDYQVTSFPGFAGHRPAFHGGFCVSKWAVLHGRRIASEFASWP
jgi:hypothetical protein